MNAGEVREKYGLEDKKIGVYVGEMSEWHGADIYNKDGIERQRDGNEDLIEKKYREKGN